METLSIVYTSTIDLDVNLIIGVVIGIVGITILVGVSGVITCAAVKQR